MKCGLCPASTCRLLGCTDARSVQIFSDPLYMTLLALQTSGMVYLWQKDSCNQRVLFTWIFLSNCNCEPICICKPQWFAVSMFYAKGYRLQETLSLCYMMPFFFNGQIRVKVEWIPKVNSLHNEILQVALLFNLWKSFQVSLLIYNVTAVNVIVSMDQYIPVGSNNYHDHNIIKRVPILEL